MTEDEAPVYICSECENISQACAGRCPKCGAFGSLTEYENES